MKLPPCLPPRLSRDVPAAMKPRRRRRWRRLRWRRTNQTWTSRKKRRGASAASGDPEKIPPTPLSFSATSHPLPPTHKHNQQGYKRLKALKATPRATSAPLGPSPHVQLFITFLLGLLNGHAFVRFPGGHKYVHKTRAEWRTLCPGVGTERAVMNDDFSLFCGAVSSANSSNGGQMEFCHSSPVTASDKAPARWRVAKFF